jgi:predicted nucleic acid-binding Zn finger protein
MPHAISTILEDREWRVLYRVMWALQASLDSEAAKRILQDEIKGMKVKLSADEVIEAGHALAEIIRKLGLNPDTVQNLLPFKGEEGRVVPVRGSGGQTYEVVVAGDAYTCTCPSFMFSKGKHCKHINRVKQQGTPELQTVGYADDWAKIFHAVHTEVLKQFADKIKELRIERNYLGGGGFEITVMFDTGDGLEVGWQDNWQFTMPPLSPENKSVAQNLTVKIASGVKEKMRIKA